MRLKLFRAPAMAAAMAQVRAELGPDALILSTRRVAGGVEITAALEPDDLLPPSLSPSPQSPPLSSPSPRPPPPRSPPPADPARLAALQFHGVPHTLHTALQTGSLAAALATTLSFDSLSLATAAPPVLLSGPPGAGKTLTVARLATRLVLAGAMPMVVTADGKRAGATEQLAAFTRLLGIDLIVASHPVTLGRALTRRLDAVPVLIDAPGCDPFDPAQVDELAALAGTASASIVLVLPGGLDPSEAADLAAAYAAAGASQLVATRLDLTRRLGGIVAAAAAGKLALTEAGIGPGAADGLVALTPAFLAERLLQPRMTNP